MSQGGILNYKMCGSKKYLYLPQGRSLKIPREKAGSFRGDVLPSILGSGGVSKTKIFKGKYEVKPKFLEGWEGSNQKPSMGVWIFFGITQKN